MRYAGAALLLGLCACNPGPETADNGGAGAANAQVPSAAPQPTPSQPAPGASAESEVRALLDEIYAPYSTDDAQSREIASFMEPALARAMTESEEGINVDPFIDAQDFKPFKPAYESIKVTGSRAEAVVRIKSFGDRRLQYLLVRTPGGWKIADIRAESGNLRDYYKLPPLN